MIYPTNFRETHRSDTALNRGGERIHFHGLDRSDYFFLSDTIIRVEAAHGGKHSILITTEGAVEVMATITALEKKKQPLVPAVSSELSRQSAVYPEYPSLQGNADRRYRAADTGKEIYSLSE